MRRGDEAGGVKRRSHSIWPTIRYAKKRERRIRQARTYSTSLFVDPVLLKSDDGSLWNRLYRMGAYTETASRKALTFPGGQLPRGNQGSFFLRTPVAESSFLQLRPKFISLSLQVRTRQGPFDAIVNSALGKRQALNFLELTHHRSTTRPIVAIEYWPSTPATVARMAEI